ncbi:hypothetical protein PS854_05583 [Pseudomonas fluorescens]|uniref:Uncharacterized protein n=1 Tax=Pseudomonas fluorescens TaxID=294 RepID=A0A5E7PZ26_PSEFL|nr:hypothetical protein PS854_05583 [Pseudomonas fluorescens]
MPAMAASHSPPLSPASRLLRIGRCRTIPVPRKPVGAGLPAMAASHSPSLSPASRLPQICVIPNNSRTPQTCRSWLASDGGVAFTTAIASKPAPTNLCDTKQFPSPHKPVGAGLPAMAASHSPPLSPASRLLQICVIPNNSRAPQTCRSWLASDGGIAFTIAIASKPAPTNLCDTKQFPYPRKPVGAGLPAMAASHSPPLSPASRLLQICVIPNNSRTPANL